jgi:hypothetical protein
MIRLILVAAASALMLTQASAHETKHTLQSEKDRPQTAWANSRDSFSSCKHNCGRQLLSGAGSCH